MFEKLDMKSMDVTGDNIAKIKALFPSAVTEVMGDDGKVKLAIDFDCLKQELSEDLISEKAERYQMTWPDKSKAKVLANSRINATLRPDKEKSVDFDNTENLYIEGDNLDVLKLLRETYLGKVKMIYIDPPYNTGNDFVYNDDFAMSADNYAEVSGQYDDQGNRLVFNTESNGRFHTDWLNMLYPRLKVARDLLTDDGVIFISIDDNELTNLTKICNEVFGEQNFVTNFIWEKKKKPSFLHKNVGKLGDYIVCYTKNTLLSIPFSIETTTEGKKYPLNNAGNTLATITFPPHSVRFLMNDCVVEPQNMSEGNIKTELLNELIIENGYNKNQFSLKGEWRYSQEKINEIIRNGEELVISKIPFRPNHIKAGGEIKKMKNFLTTTHYHMETNEDATEQVVDLMGSDVFDNPKPIKLIESFIKSITYDDKSAIVLDFFSGSATTAHAVMQLNAEDGGNRKFIMVQLPEKCDEKSEAYKAGYKTICEIGQERIRRAGKKIKEEGGLTTQDLDVGFRVLKLDSSNMQEVYYNPSAMTQDILAMTVDNVKADRTPLDLLFQVMLDLGIELSAKIDEHTVNGKTYYAVNENDIIACFDDIDNDLITQVAKQKPLYAVFKDKSFATDSVGINNEQLFKTYSPSTVVKVI